MNRVLSQHGNVVAVDFRKARDITVTIKTEILYADASAILARVSFSHDGKAIDALPPQHLLADLSTGKVIST